MIYRFIALSLLILAGFFGYAFVGASGARIPAQIILGYLAPLSIALPLAIVWWRQTTRGW